MCYYIRLVGRHTIVYCLSLVLLAVAVDTSAQDVRVIEWKTSIIRMLSLCISPFESELYGELSHFLRVLIKIWNSASREGDGASQEKFYNVDVRSRSLKSIKLQKFGYHGNFTENVRQDCSLNTGWAKKTDHFWKYVTPVYDDAVRQSIHQNVQLFIRSKVDILNRAALRGC